MNNSNPGGQKEEQGIPADIKKLITVAKMAYKEQCKVDRDSGHLADCDFGEGAEWAYRLLSEKREGPVWVKADLSQGWNSNDYSTEVIVKISGMSFKYDVTNPSTIVYFLKEGREIYFIQEEQINDNGK